MVEIRKLSSDVVTSGHLSIHPKYKDLLGSHTKGNVM